MVRAFFRWINQVRLQYPHKADEKGSSPNILIKPMKKVQVLKNKPAIRLSQVRSAIDSYLLIPSEIRSDGKNYI